MWPQVQRYMEKSRLHLQIISSALLSFLSQIDADVI